MMTRALAEHENAMNKEIPGDANEGPSFILAGQAKQNIMRSIRMSGIVRANIFLILSRVIVSRRFAASHLTLSY